MTLPQTPKAFAHPFTCARAAPHPHWALEEFKLFTFGILKQKKPQEEPVKKSIFTPVFTAI